jgi:hypothetical protein
MFLLPAGPGPKIKIRYNSVKCTRDAVTLVHDKSLTVTRYGAPCSFQCFIAGKTISLQFLI